MPELAILVPSLGRPDAAAELATVFADTCTGETLLYFVVDEDDPTRDAYITAVDGVRSAVMVTPTQTMVEALNFAAVRLAGTDCFAIGFMGDDHRPRTTGWDTAYVEALRELGTGIAYGDDLLQGEKLPTQCAMTADIVRAIGYMAPPKLRHMYVDNFWLTLGRAAGCIRYLPGVVVEHMHPIAGKSEWTEGHRRVNAQSVYDHDRTVFQAWRAWGMPRDVAAVCAARTQVRA